MVGDLTWGVMTKDLDGLSRRLEATSQNIANMNTPGYARQEVSFEDQLKEIVDAPRMLPVKRTSSRHISNVKTDISEVKAFNRSVGYEVYRYDMNNVDPETETARLTQTRMLYQGISRAMSKKISAYKRVIGGGS